jgi:uncharacterized protein YqeY
MSLKDNLARDLQDAIRSGDATRKTTLRAVIAEIKKTEVPQVIEHRIAPGDSWQSVASKHGADATQLARSYGVSADDPIPERDEDDVALTKLVVPLPVTAVTDDSVLSIVAKQVKQRRDSIDAFKKASRQDLVDREMAELTVLEAYLPAQLSPDDISAEARAVIAEVGASGPGDKGKVMSALMARLAGRADGRTVNEVVTELLSSASVRPK